MNNQSKTSTPVRDGSPQRAAAGSAQMVLVMGTVGLLASIILVGTYKVTEPFIAANRASYLEAAIFDIIPGAVQSRAYVVTRDGEMKPAGEDPTASGTRVFLGLDESGQMIGLAIEARGQGFADVIRLLYGYSPARDLVTGIKVLDSRETPGLGDKIEKDGRFTENVSTLDVRLDDERRVPLHDIELVKRGEKTDGWQLEAITGATISSRAVANILRESVRDVLPALQANLEGIGGVTQ